MGDYVLESNPALGRLIERLGAQDNRPGSEESSNFQDSRRFQRRGRSKFPKRARENPTTAGTRKRADALVQELRADALVQELVVEDDLCAIHEDPQAADEIVLIDFDEEPAIFPEELGDGEILMEGDEEDEVLDVYGRADLNEFGETTYVDAEAFNEIGILLEEDQNDDGASVLAVSAVEDEAGDWIFDAFKAWMLEVDTAIA